MAALEIQPLRILGVWYMDSAVDYYRVKLPCDILRSLGHHVTLLDRPLNECRGSREGTLAEWFSEQVGIYDLILTERLPHQENVAMMAGLRHFSPDCRLLTDLDDDFINLPRWNRNYKHFLPGTENRNAGLLQLLLSEAAIVSTPPLANSMADKAHKVFVAPNFIDPSDWEGFPVNPERFLDPYVRIFYGGAQGHFGDVDVARPGLEKILRNPPVPVRLVCFGSAPTWMHDLAREIPGRIVVTDWVQFKDYPAAVAWGGFDLAIAPLADHIFNQSKSLVKPLESALQGIPMVCSNVGPYKDIPTGCAIRVDPGDWYEALEVALTDSALRESLVSHSYEWVKDTWTVDKGVGVWDNILEQVQRLPRIETLEDTQLPSAGESQSRIIAP